MASIPTYNYNNDVNRFKYLEKVDKTPDFKDPALYKKADSFIKYRNHSVKKETSGDKLKAAVGSILGTIIPMVFMMKKQGVKNPLKLKYGLRDMLVLSAAPIIGGVSVGMIGNDAETNYGKSREGVFQFFNAAIPTWLAGGALRLCETTKGINNIPAKMASILGAVIVGMYGAASISNLVCDPKDKYPDRKLTVKDSFANLDDVVGVLVLAKFPLADKLHIEKILPAIYASCGYRAGKSN